MQQPRRILMVSVLIGVSVLATTGEASAELTIVRHFIESELPRRTMHAMGAMDVWPLMMDGMTVRANLMMEEFITLQFMVPDGMFIEVRGQAMVDFHALMWDANSDAMEVWPQPPYVTMGMGHFIGFMNLMGEQPGVMMDVCGINPDGLAVLWNFPSDPQADPPILHWTFTGIEMTIDLRQVDFPDVFRAYYVGEQHGGLELIFPDPSGFSVMAPEPTTMFIMGAAALPLLWRRRRKACQ